MNPPIIPQDGLVDFDNLQSSDEDSDFKKPLKKFHSAVDTGKKTAPAITNKLQSPWIKDL